MKKNTKKRKIQIPAAQFGLPVSLSNMQELQSSMARGTAPNNPNNLMIKNNPANTNIGNISEIAQAIPGAINTLTSPFQTSTATTGGEAAMQSITGIGEGLASGAQLGMSIGGPIGGIVGGIAGAATGLIGKKGKKASMTSFTDYDEGTLGTGLIGAFKNKKLRKRRAAIRLNAFQNREAIAGTERLANEFNEDNTEFDTDVFEYGGNVPSSLAYVDDGELIATPDGQVNKVPEQGQPTDSNLINLPEGSRILSNTLKVPGTNKTFAELGDKMMAKKKSKGKDIYAQNADMLNEMNNKLMHDKLFAMQENLKAKKGIKNKTKELKTFAKGGDNLPVGYNAAGFMIDPRFAGEISMGVSAPTPRIRDTWGIKGDVTATPQDIRTRSIMPTIGTNPTTVNTPEVNSPNWVDAISDFATLAPIMSNLFTGNPESVQANYNPYASAIANTMGRRRYNINPLLRDIEQNRDVANYSASQQMTNTGHNMAFRLQNAIQANKAKAAARATESNVNNQYKGEYANAMNDLGKQWVNATNLASDLNAQNRASARNIRRAGLSQLSQFAQNKTLMRNQSKRDRAMLELYKPFLQAGFTSDTIKNWSKYLR